MEVGLAGTAGGGLVTKMLNKRTDSVRDVKKPAADEDKQPPAKPRKGKENKKESSAGSTAHAANAANAARGSTSSCSAGVACAAWASADAKDTQKEVKFRDQLHDGGGGGGVEEAVVAASDGGPPGSVGSGSGSGSPKVPHKFISNWKHACDKTRDRTRDLLKRWRTAPEGIDPCDGPSADAPQSNNWSVHVWATWVKRLPSEEEGFLDAEADNSAALLSAVQREKLSQFFAHLVDSDRDDVVSRQDFENLSERLRHFADWSDNSSEYHILREVEQNFVSTFLDDGEQGRGGRGVEEGRTSVPDVDSNVIVRASGERERLCSLDQWLSRWGAILDKAKTFNDLPVWLQYFPRVMFQVINKSGTGVVSRDELSAFYSSVLGLGAQRVGEVLDSAYKAMTANGDYPLCFPTYRWCFANFLLGRHRNGPGQYLFGPGEPAEQRACPFPVDYSALNSAPEELEQYSPDRKSNRRSVIV